MRDPSDNFILKVLTGSQSGVEVSMYNGEYTIGSGANDDLQFVDLSLKNGHARLRLSNGTIEVAGGAGSVAVAIGSDIQAGDETWREIEPLEIFTIGTTSLALGPASAQWSDLVGASDTRDAARLSSNDKPDRPVIGIFGDKWTKISWAGVGLVVAIVFIGWATSSQFSRSEHTRKTHTESDFNVVRGVLDDFEFGRPVLLRQEADGVLFATGYVDEQAERRALVNAIDETGIPVRLRVWVLSSLRSQIHGIIKAQNVPVNYQLSNEGVISVTGDVLAQEKADKFLTTIENEIRGISTIRSEIKTANTYLQEIRELSELSQISDTVLLRLEGELIEASGVVVPEKLDRFIGFIQSYARRFADHIPLRSFVQVVNERGDIIAEPDKNNPGAPVLIGEAGNDTPTGLNLSRLKQGSFSARDVFLGLDASLLGDTSTGGKDQSVTRGKDQSVLSGDGNNSPPSVAQLSDATEQPSTGDVQQESGALIAQASALEGAPINLQVPEDIAGQKSPDSEHSTESSQALKKYLTDGLLEEKKGGLLKSTKENRALHKVFETVAARWNQTIDVVSDEFSAERRTSAPAVEDRFVALFARPKIVGQHCWPGSHMTEANLPSVLFWLDLLSASDEMSLSSFEMSKRHLILEAALNPNRVRMCAVAVERDTGADLNKMSLYLDETSRNPDFVRFVLRDLPKFSMQISGVMLGESERYIQMPNGNKIREGSVIDGVRRVANVGELGLVMQLNDRLETNIYDEVLRWKAGDKGVR